MAYAALISLKHTLQRLLNSSHISLLLSNNKKDIEFACEQAESLQRLLEELDRRRSSRSSKRVAVLDGQIKDAAHKLEDVLESHVSNQFLPQSKDLLGGKKHRKMLFSIDRKSLKQGISSFAETVKRLKQAYIKELSKSLPEKDDASNSSVRSTAFGRNKSEMVGLSVEYNKLKEDLLPRRNFFPIFGMRQSRMINEDKVVSIVGMAGIGKTTLAMKFFQDPTTLNCFKHRVWVTIGHKYQLKEIVQSIIDQVDPDISKMCASLGDETYRWLSHGQLVSRLGTGKYLIVLDDVWDRKVWDDLKSLFPNNKNESRVLVTTRLEEVSRYVSRAKIGEEEEMRSFLRYGRWYHLRDREEAARRSPPRYHPIHEMRLLKKEESWCLLRKKVFADELCPSQLEKAGKQIAENCEGLPLAIVTVAKLLSKAEKTIEYWEMVAKRPNSVFEKAYDKMSKVLLPSYDYLPRCLKACFLYMGVFPQNSVIATSRLINLWRAEGFLETGQSKTFEYFAMECLKNLVSNNVLMVRQHSYDYRIKTCALHSAFWQLCVRLAVKNKFLHVLNSYGDGLAESIKGQRRLCIHNNILFGIKDVHSSMASISAAHSLLCTGQHHQYPVPLCFGLRLLRVLDALTIRLYEFPEEVLDLVHLRYLALTFNGKLPAPISQLWNLQFLIVRRHLIINSHADSSYLPVEIWDMKELKHLQIMGSDLPVANGGVFLQNLLTLLDVSARSCTKGVLGNIPHLKKLGFRIELAPDAAELSSCFDYISDLSSLESLKCVVVSPMLVPEVAAASPVLLSMFPARLKKLSLSGFGYGWEDMNKIASSLPDLKVLKLRCYAFRGPEWKTHEKEFPKLEYLLIEDTDLVDWKCDSRCFPSLKRLTIRHCYKLKQVPQMSHSEFQMIVVDSTPSVVTV